MNKIKQITLLIILAFAFCLTACSNQSRLTDSVNEDGAGTQVSGTGETDIESDNNSENETGNAFTMDINETLSKTTDIRPGYGTTYEVFVYSFFDSDGDGIGDFNGLTSRLEYISDLGFDGIWMMPISPSPTYHKYDVTDYYGIDPEYGTMADFENFMAACNELGIRVIIDLVINHSSSKHPWFLRAVEYLKGLDGAEPDITECPELDFYHFSRERKSGYYRVPGTEDWFYEAVFWSEMPDLNLDNEQLRTEIENITAFWFAKGVNGFRIDAAKEFFSGAPGKNIEVLTWFNDMVKIQNPDAYIVAEVWDTAAVYAPYLESGIDSVFNFTFANQNGVIAKTVRGQRAASAFGKAMVEHDELLSSFNPDYIDAPFYTNHDLGRSAGYYNGDFAYAQAKTALALNLLMSGNTFTYYGDELGMNGAGIDENKRLAMFWSEDEKAPGMCTGPADRENIKKRYPSYEIQKDDPLSIFNYTRNALRIRNAFPEIIQGKVMNLDDIATEALAAFTKSYDGSQITVLANLSTEEVVVKLDSIADIQTGSGITAVLLTDEKPVKIEDGMMMLPPFSIVIFK